jgi:hypothetical protein
MTDFNKILKDCKEVNAISALVVDKFLMYYAASRDRLDLEVDQRLTRFRFITKGFEPAWVNLIKAQYICHRIFKEGGLIKKYLNHADVKSLPPAQLNFLQKQTALAWKYLFSEIVANPEKDFYEMEDVFSGERFLLHSVSTTEILSEQPVRLWFNLTMFNGSCWQTFGPVVWFLSFEPDDIFFFATELNSTIESEEDLLADVESNPIPYLMLIQSSRIPRIVQGKDEILQVVAEYPLDILDGEGLRKHFRLEFAKGVYRISKEPWSDPPHFAVAYYIEETKTLRLNAMTDRGFRNMVGLLNTHGLGLSADPDIRVRLSMLKAVKDILRKDEILDPYEKFFEKKTSPEHQETMEKLNRLLSLAMPFINSGQQPDVEKLAKEAGVDPETARDLLSKSMGRINELRNRVDKKGGK